MHKAGLFSAFADNHVIRAPIAGGRISGEGMLAVELTVKAAQMTVLDPTLSADKRAEVQARMHGPEVLDTARYPDIRFTSTRIAPDGADRWQVIGDLTLHGTSRPLTIVVVRRDGRFRGTVSIRQREFGIRPISIAGGTVKVKDEVHIDFDIVGTTR
jgi:polyisoprenoid-binding protein YceI